MLSLYLALGIIGGPVPVNAIVTPPDRTIAFTRAGGSVTAAQSIDPADVTEFVLDCSGLLDAGETAGAPTVSLLADAIARGFQIRQTPAAYAPQVLSNTQYRIFVSVAAVNQLDPAWASGQACGFTFDIDTGTTPPRHYQRTGFVTVIQK